MIKECLNTLSMTKLDIGDKRRRILKTYVDRCDESQFLNIMMTPQGLIVDDINIYYYPNVGFRCMNDPTVTGHLPICNIIQRVLNEDIKNH